MVRISYEQKPYRRLMMATWGGECIAESERPDAGGAKDPGRESRFSRSLGIAISEAIEDAVGDEDSRYSLGSVLNHVLLHQTVIGLEAEKQFEKIGEYPDVVMGCAGGGSNFAGIALPFVRDKIHGKEISIVVRRARLLPDPDPRAVRLRFRRHCDDHASSADAHPGARLFARADSRRRVEIPRNGADSLPSCKGRNSRGKGLRSDRDVYGGG